MDFDVSCENEGASGLNLVLCFLCLQKCLTVSHRSGELEASTKITMTVSSASSLLLNRFTCEVSPLWPSSSRLTEPLKAQHEVERAVSSIHGEVNLSVNPDAHAQYISNITKALVRYIHTSSSVLLLCIKLGCLDWPWSLAFISDQKYTHSHLLDFFFSLLFQASPLTEMLSCTLMIHAWFLKD